MNSDESFSESGNKENDESMDCGNSTQAENRPKLSEKLVRKAYRKYREEMIDNRLECVDPNSNLIETIMDKVEKTFNSVKKPREAVSDSCALHELAILGKERIKNLKCAFRSFNNNEFMDKLKDYMANQESTSTKQEPTQPGDDSSEEETTQLNRSRNSKKSKKYVLKKEIIENFGTNVMSYFHILPQPKCLVGSLEKELLLSKKKIQRQRKEKKSDEEVRTKIKELDVNDNNKEANNTVSETERIYTILKKYFKKNKGNPLCLYTFLVNPVSFSRTIENIFYISFLVKDGYAKIYLDDDNMPVIEPVVLAQSADATQQAEKATNIQSMVSLNKNQWKEIIQVFEIEQAMIPDPVVNKS